MARVTVEDCIEKTEGVFSLIKLASQRARRIANGAETLLENEENDKPTVLALREIAEGHLDNPEFHKTESDVEKELAEELEMDPARVARLRRAAIRPASLDSPIGDDHSTFAEIISDEKAQNPYKHLEDKTVTDMLHDLVKTLPHREATILEYRFGLDGGLERTLEEVGEHFGVTRERVRQIQNLALSKMRKMIEHLESVQK